MLSKIIIVLSLLSFSHTAVGQSSKKVLKKKVLKKKTTKVRDGDFVRMDSTNLDFGEEAIEGRVKAPEGFFLRGRSSQELLQTVKLRSDFRNELKTTKNGVVSLTR